METIKNFLKKILPPPVRTFLREIEGLRKLTERLNRDLAQNQKQLLAAQRQQTEQTERLLKAQNRQAEQLERLLAIQEQQNRQTAALAEKGERMEERLTALEQRLVALDKLDAIRAETGEVKAALAQQKSDLQQAERQRKELGETLERIRGSSAESVQYASEAVWAQVFNNAISGSAWLKNTAFSPGRWAVGYPVLYVMYRVLNEVRPKRILELGLGQSTRMIAQYAAAHEDVEHIVVEHDPEWINFFQNDFALSERTKILRLDREMVPFKEAEAVRVFKGFREALEGQKFDFICIDAPLGGDMKQYARIDVLGLMPECLNEDFVIMLDDTERSGEGRTFAEMRRCLSEHGIEATVGWYRGKKDMCLLSSKRNGFVASM